MTRGIPTNRKAPHSSPTLTRKTDSATPGVKRTICSTTLPSSVVSPACKWHSEALKWAPPQGLIENLPKSLRPSAGRPEQEGEPSTRKTSDDSRSWTGWARLPARISVPGPPTPTSDPWLPLESRACLGASAFSRYVDETLSYIQFGIYSAD
ncbi:uncharacterized protein BDZ83DRAFT_400455 [Colletotrichum acutatum]|uniref:Uncharacterized protein n=1 Tax=Glomerella acutata TaxID=27357 RepID=A0AAD9D183_GLOAC|nr:uncharacterized protein BDZ83DRAFT_400455 [Colletotrichum acutatum]KAK1730282.1 hypothetical protein BDZ83DRAFT_400455 [Colletotrichum acutatum]